MLPEGKLLEKEEAPEKSTFAAAYSAFSCSICRGFPQSHIRGMEAPFSSEPGKDRGPQRDCTANLIFLKYTFSERLAEEGTKQWLPINILNRIRY